MRNIQKWFFSTSLKRGKSLGKYWFWMEQLFLSNQWNGTNIDENGFPPQNNPFTAPQLFCCFEVFSRKLTENFAFISKMWLFQIEPKNYSESYFFPTSLKKGKSWEKFWFDGNNFFLSNQWKGAGIKKQTFFLLKIRHIQLNYTFLVLWSIFAEIDWKLLFLGQKRDHLRKKLRNTHNLIETPFFVKPVKWDKYWRKCFSSSKWATYS